MILFALTASLFFISGCAAQKQNDMTYLKLSSPAFPDNGVIPSLYTCDGKDVNPTLTIEGVPPDAKSLALIVDDPDAPRGDWVHWTLWNIPPDTAEIKENSVPYDAVEGMTDFGRAGWGGPCPPSGVHRYQFKLYALDARLNLATTSRKPDIERAMEGYILDQTILIGEYARQ